MNAEVDILLHPERADIGDVERILEDYPFYTLPAALLLRRDGAHLDADLRKRLTHAVALNCSDPASLYMLLEPEASSHATFYPDEAPATPSTDSAIDTFLNTYGTQSAEEDAALERLIFNPTPDYASLLEREELESLPQEGDAPAGSHDDLLNKFILKQKEQEGAIAATPSAIPTATVVNRVSEQSPPPAPDDSLLSESLARIFIKQRQYERAYEIISQLNLNYPEKSAYFADQLRFLRKLINNSRHRNLRNAEKNI